LALRINYTLSLITKKIVCSQRMYSIQQGIEFEVRLPGSLHFNFRYLPSGHRNRCLKKMGLNDGGLRTMIIIAS